MTDDLAGACSCLRESLPAVLDQFSGRYGFRPNVERLHTPRELHGEFAAHAVDLERMEEPPARCLLGLAIAECLVNGGELEPPAWSVICCPYLEPCDA